MRTEYLLVVRFLGSSMVEHAAVNRRVVGSSPTRGAFSVVRSDDLSSC